MRYAGHRAAFAALAVLAALSAGRPARAQGLETSGGTSLGTGPAGSAMQGALLADPTSREQIISLQDDPLMQSILSDPATMRAVEAGDLGALMANPKIQALGKNPTVRSLVEQQTR